LTDGVVLRQLAADILGSALILSANYYGTKQ